MRCFINQILKTMYPNKATKNVKNIRLFPFKIIFKLLLDDSFKMDKNFIKTKLIYVESKDDLFSIQFGKKYDKYSTWIFNSFLDIGLLSKDKDRYFIDEKYKEYVSELLKDDLKEFFINKSLGYIDRGIKHYKYKRNITLVKETLKKSNYKCFFNEAHNTFISKSTKKQYMEVHHIISMSFQNSFKKDLNCIENLISVCPTCHRKIHLSVNDEKKILLEDMFREICIAFNDLEEEDLKEIYCG